MSQNIKDAITNLETASHFTLEMAKSICECIAVLADQVSAITERVEALETNIINPEEDEAPHKKRSHH